MRYVAAMPFFVHGNALVARVELHHSHGASNKTVCMQSYGACSRHRAALKGGSNRPLVWVCISSPHPTLLYLFFFFFYNYKNNCSVGNILQEEESIQLGDDPFSLHFDAYS